LSIAYNSALSLVSGDFTIETWVYFNDVTSGTVLNKDGISGASYSQYAIELTSSGVLGLNLGNGNGVSPTFTTYTFGSVAVGQWYHVAAVKTGSTIKTFLNGTQVTSTAQVTAMSEGSKALLVGYQTSQPSNAYLNGYVTNLRIVKGTALYTANFTPPKSSILEAIPNTSLLLQCANSTNATVDSSPNKFTVTNNGNVGYSVPGISYLNSNLGSISFNGSSQYLTVASNTAFDLGTTYTIEFWMNPNALGTNGGGLLHIGFYTTGIDTWTSNVAFSIRILNSKLRCYFYGTSLATEQYIDTTSSPTIGAWNHIAMVRNGTSGAVYINGVAAGTITGLNTPAASSRDLKIGIWDYSAGNEYYNGYLSNIRIVKGTALYTADFTPPKVVLPAITNTSLLLQVANSSAFITDSSTNGFTVTNNGTATYNARTPVASVGEMQKIYSDGTISVANYFDETIPSLQVSTLIIAGGGGGSAGAALVGGGGGGAGGLISTSANLNTGTWTVTVGQGGAAGVGGLNSGANGTNTVLTSGATTYTAIGGGAGSGNTTSYDGGSGGGIPGGSGTPGQALQPSSSSGGLGSNGSLGSGSYGGSPCDAGSGGGAGGGSAGYSNSISGSAVTYSAGGAGGAAYGTNNGSAGATYGSGGGGGGGQGYAGATGANGAIIISYAGSQKATGGTVTTVGANTVHTFTANGTFTY
jgi:hypothetical protein